ncbi:murein hydrolase activator EnvC family protein [Laceyella putida]|uniref:Murein hydrolase activator EnvC family protein n=1 Tax=Laceyella putida TaxID=110101 RepID=A0ABW2RG79_9BACL
MKRKNLVGMLLMTLVFSLMPQGISLAYPNSSGIEQRREDIKQNDKEIQQLEKKKKLAEQDEQVILGEIEAKEKELNQLERNVYETEQRVEQGKRTLAEIEQLLKEKKQTYYNRLRTVYLQGNVFYLEMLLKSDTFGDFLERIDLITMINRSDRQLLNQYRQEQQLWHQTQVKLQEEHRRLEEQKRVAKQSYDELQAKMDEHKELVASIDSSLQELEEKNEAAKKELNRMVAEAERQAKERERQQYTAAAGNGADGEWLWPVRGGVLTSSFGSRYHPVHHTYRMHEGIDIGAPMGTPIMAAASGEVIEARPSSGYGYIVVVYHGNGLSTLYAHMYANTVKVRVGDQVKQGQEIAAVGSNGWATGPHLHFEVHEDSKPVDPMKYFR